MIATVWATMDAAEDNIGLACSRPADKASAGADLPQKVLHNLCHELVGWETESGGDTSKAGRKQAFDDAVSLARGLRDGAPAQVRAAADKILARGLRGYVGLHLAGPLIGMVDGADADIGVFDFLLWVGGTVPKGLAVCSACSWVFEAKQPRALCDRCGSRPEPAIVKTAAYSAVPLPQYRDGKPHGWRIARLGLCHECGRTILPEEMGKSNKKTCGPACRTTRHRRRMAGDESDWSARGREELAYLEADRLASR